MNDHKTHFCLEKGLFSFNSSPGIAFGKVLPVGVSSLRTHWKQSTTQGELPGPRGRLVFKSLTSSELINIPRAPREARVREEPQSRRAERRRETAGRTARTEGAESAWRRRSPALGTRSLAIIARTIFDARAATPPARSRRSGRAAGESGGPEAGITPAVSPRPGHPAPGSPRNPRLQDGPPLLATPPSIRRP